MARLSVPKVSGTTEQLIIEYADPQAATRGEKGWGELGFKVLKTVDVADLEIEDDAVIVPLAKGETAPGRAFRAVAVRTVNDIPYPSKPTGYDYANRPPYTAGKIKESFVVGEKGARIALAAHLYDPDARPSKLEIVPDGEFGSKEQLPSWAALQGTDLVIDTAEPRTEAVVAVRLKDEKEQVAILDVIVTVIEPEAPDTPGDVVYLAL